MSAEIVSLAARRAARHRRARLQAGEPFCKACEAARGEINDVVPFLMRLPGGCAETWHYCPTCEGEERGW
jgi:hypothetical protein